MEVAIWSGREGDHPIFMHDRGVIMQYEFAFAALAGFIAVFVPAFVYGLFQSAFNVFERR